MLKRAVFLLVIFICLISLTGCATARKQKDLQIQGLRNQILALEAQLQMKDQEIESLRGALGETTERKASERVIRKKKVVGEVKSRPSVRHIQTALKNAGYNPGSIDGEMGRQTRDAIRAFQRANNLPVDGKVGRQTWSILGKYLYQKVK